MALIMEELSERREQQSDKVDCHPCRESFASWEGESWSQLGELREWELNGLVAGEKGKRREEKRSRWKRVGSGEVG